MSKLAVMQLVSIQEVRLLTLESPLTQLSSGKPVNAQEKSLHED